MKHYIGRRHRDGALLVTVRNEDEQERDLDPRFDLRRHSPTGFGCGYGGSGPAQLALAILADCLGDEFALGHYQAYKFAVIGRLPQDENWVLSETEVTSVARGLVG